MNYEETIRNILVVLQGVTVQGRENWDRLLACDQGLRSILQDMEQKKHQAEKQAAMAAESTE